MNLSSPVNATINRGREIGSILNRMTKFFVADGGTPRTYEYGSGGRSEEITPEASGNTAPRGVATTAAGTTVWVADADRNVYVYTNYGVLQGSWTASGLSSSMKLTGIATKDTDLWLVDSYVDKVYKYAGAASRLSGSHLEVPGTWRCSDRGAKSRMGPAQHRHWGYACRAAGGARGRPT
jgi:hypothetical protein